MNHRPSHGAYRGGIRRSGSAKPLPARRRPLRRGVLLASLLLPAAGAACHRAEDSGARPQTRGGPVPVTVARAVTQDVPVQVQAIGWGEAYATVAVKPRVEGQITEIRFTEGQMVKAGDHLFTIDPRPYVAALHLAEANLARDRALADDARRDHEWIKGLFEQHTAAQRELDRAAAKLAAADATVRADEAAVEDAALRLEYCTIRSPLDGRSGDLLVDLGNVVKQNDTTLVQIDQLHPLFVSFSVAEQHLTDIRKFMREAPLAVEAVIPGDSGEPESGVLTFLDNRVDSTTGMVRLKGTFKNEQRRLWPGQYVNVVLRLANRENQVVVPTHAVQTGQKGPFVFVVRDGGIAQMRPVVPGEVLANRTVIREGLQTGETVVTDGHLRLVDGARVEVKGDSDRINGRVAAADQGAS